MALTAEQRKVDLVDRLASEARARVAPPLADSVEHFVRRYFALVAPDDIIYTSLETLLGSALSLYEFGAEREPGQAKVRLFNPNVEKNGWGLEHTVIEIVNDDMPFLVDSVTMEVNRHGLTLHLIIHPIVAVVRDADGTLTGVADDGQAAQRESMIHVEVDRIVDPAKLDELAADIVRVLDDVRAAFEDWKKMRDRVGAILMENEKRAPPLPPDELAEGRAFLSWLANDHFTFLGYRRHELVVIGGNDALKIVPGSSLGILREGENKEVATSFAALPPEVKAYARRPELLVVTKSTSRSTVHRPGYMDYIGVLGFDAKGRPTSEQRFLGLYTSSAYNRRPWDIPVVRQRHEYVMQQSGLDPNSHSGKALRHILETLPRDELFQSSEAELLRTATGILGLQERVRSKLFLRRDRYGRFFSALVYIPRDRFNTDVRSRIEAMLKRGLHGDSVDTTVQVGESPLAQLHMIVRPKSGEAIEIDTKALESELAEIVRNRYDDLREQLLARHGEERGLKLASTYGRALPTDYVAQVSPAAAADDVESLAALAGPEDLKITLYRRDDGSLRLKFYRLGDDIPLSDILPMMENMGLRVMAEHPYRIEIGAQVAYIQDFEVEVARSGFDIDRVDENFEEAFAQLWRGQAENDGFNRLIIGAGLSWRQVAMLRAYSKYLQQVGVPFSQAYVEQTLSHYPLLARLLVELFEARFDPATGREDKAAIKDGVQRLQRQFEVLSGGDATGSTAFGDAMAFLGTLGWIVYTRGATRFPQLDVIDYTALTVIASWPLLLAGALLATALGLASPPSPADLGTSWHALLYVGLVSSALAVLAYNFGVRSLGSVTATAFLNFVPVSALLMSLALGKPPAAHELAGLVMVGLALLVHTRASVQTPTPARRPAGSTPSTRAACPAAR